MRFTAVGPLLVNNKELPPASHCARLHIPQPQNLSVKTKHKVNAT